MLGHHLQASGLLTKAVALSYFKLLAIKDEWEVARLYSSDSFAQQLQSVFEGDFTLHFYLGVWPFEKKNSVTGKIRKTEQGPWTARARSWPQPLQAGCSQCFPAGGGG